MARKGPQKLIPIETLEQAADCLSCGDVCDYPDAYETGACIDGNCEYWCIEGAANCDGRCTSLNDDPENCGTCGNVCGGSTPVCINGACTDCSWGTICDGTCADLTWDNANCGSCGNVCGGWDVCVEGVCVAYYGYDPYPYY
jgi:hypothetical protein